jgi:hypothetical protein
MGLSLSTASAALKEFYEPGMREQLNNDIPLLAQLEKNTEDIEGKRAVLSLHTRRNSGVGARAELGTLPTAGNQGTAEERVPTLQNYGRMQVSGPTIRAMRTNRGSFKRAIAMESEGLVRDLKRDVNRQAWGTSDGVIATCGTTSGAVIVVLAATTSDVKLRQLEVGMVIDIADTADPPVIITNGSARTIQSVDTTNKTVTIDAAGGNVTTSSSHRIYRSGAGGGGASQKEITGMQSIVASSGTLHNVNPTVDPSWVATVDSNGGTNRSLSENLIAKAMQNAQILGGGWAKILIGSPGVIRALSNLLTSLKRFPGTTNLKGGYSGLDFTAGGPTIPAVWDRDCPANSLYGLDTDHLTEYQMSDWEFMEEDGNVLNRVANVDAYESTLFKYHEVATDKRNAHFVIKDITEA